MRKSGVSAIKHTSIQANGYVPINYAKLENGVMRLWQWFEDKPAIEIFP